MGMVEEAEVYVLNGADHWIDFPNPGAVYLCVDGTASPTHTKGVEVI